MPQLRDRLRLLEPEPADAVSAIVSAALARAEPQEREAIAAAALATRKPPAVAAVIAHLHDLGDATSAALSGRPLDAALLRLSTCGDGQAIRNGIGLARERRDAGLAAWLAGCLDSPAKGVAAAAAEALLAITVAHLGPDGRRRADAAAARRIDDAVSAAIGAHGSYRADVLLAAALLANRRGTRTAGLLAEADEALLLSLRAVAGRTGEPLVAANLLRWLTSPQLGAQACRRMHEALGDLPELLGSAHLLRAPRRRLALRHADRAARCVPPIEAVLALPPPLQVSAVRLMCCLPAAASVRRSWLCGCASMTSPVAKLAAIGALRGVPDGESQRALESLCFDPSEAVAMAAFRSLDLPAVPALQHSPHRSLARRALRRHLCRDVDAFFDRLLDLGSADRIMAARQLLAAAPQRMEAGLARAVSSGSRALAMEAMALARRLAVTDRVEAVLIARTEDTDARVAASAIAALGDAGSSRRLDAVMACLGHPDDRVKANAVETLMRIRRLETSHLDAFLAGGDNRLRANAVLALLRARPGPGGSALSGMLADGDPRHRASAVWVARRARAAAVAPDLKRLAAGDRFPEIRTRAAAAATMIEHACHRTH